MLYIIADRERAAWHGFGGPGYATNGDRICINEKDLANCTRLSGTLESRAAEIGGRVVTHGEAREEMSRK